MRSLRKGIRIYIAALVVAVLTITPIMGQLNVMIPQEAAAAVISAKDYTSNTTVKDSDLVKSDKNQNDETVTIRIIGTTDLHGQLNSKNYEMGVDYNNGGLARVFNMIKQIREEMPSENIITIDAGDVLYDYTTEYIYGENQDAIQPIYQAMARVGYDAITLGNHDFDYGYEYILRQLTGSGLKDIAVVSNVVDSKTGEYPFLENMLITRMVKAESGQEVEVKIGIIGQTIPTLTAKTHSYAGILKTEDIVSNAQSQAAKLKDMGADIIIALSHTGIGPEEPELNFKNAAYALTRIPEIDVVVCGHEHNIFPTSNMSSPYYKLPNVDKKTYLMNGKNVIMAGDRGEAVGVVDLTLKVTAEAVKIVNRTSELRMITADNTKEDPEIAKMFSAWEDRLLNFDNDIIGQLKEDEIIQNFYGLLSDNSAIQLLNDAKLQFARRFSHTTGKQYKKYPIVAASNYASYGVDSIDEFIKLQGEIKVSDLRSIQHYNNYLYIYTITGKQLKEWLEWSASAFESPYINRVWTDDTMAALIKKQGIKSLISEEWLDNWYGFYVFDGIDYVINPANTPRYDVSGNRISSSTRIQSLRYNGEDITDDMELLLVTNKITIPADANKGVETQVAYKGFTRTQSVLSKYIQQIAKSGSIMPQVDNNWKISWPDSKGFIIRAPYYAHNLITDLEMYKDYLGEYSQYRYYKASYPKEEKDSLGPHIVAAPLVTTATASPYGVAVNVTDMSGIKQLRYMSGDFSIDYTGWVVARNIQNNEFTVRENGTYTIYAQDMYGNESIQKVIIDNFSDNMLGTPTVDSYTNRKTKISGTAEPLSNIYFETATETYESKVGINGKFSYNLPSQPSGLLVTVYVKDEEKGIESERLEVIVKRTGPNKPFVNPVYNDAAFINGNTYDNDAKIIAIIDNLVYVSSNGGRELYEKNTEIYNQKLKIVEISAEVFDNGYFLMQLPPQIAGTVITVYSLDHLGRNSMKTTVKVEDVAPNAPVVYDISNIEKSIRGYIPSPEKKVYDITVNIAGNKYKTKSNKKGEFFLEFDDQLHEDQVITVTATDIREGVIRNSYPTKAIVKNINDFVRINSTDLNINRMIEGTAYISGNHSSGGTVYLAVSKGEGDSFENNIYKLETDKMTRFRQHIDYYLEAGSIVYAMVRFDDGNILYANIGVVLPEAPDAPVLVSEITNTDKLVRVAAAKDCEVILTIGSKTYTTTQYQYDELSGLYIYSLATDRVKSGTKVTVKASNITGTSDILTSVVMNKAPDSPQVNKPKAGDTVITGWIELLDYQVADAIETDSGKLPKSMKNAPAEVVKTRTRVYVLVGSKTYEGTIDADGNFSITVPALSAGTSVKVWGSNKAGRGPLVKVKVNVAEAL